MSIKKYSSGSWVTVPYRKYETATDTITSLPQTIIGDGQNISAYTIKGNMTQASQPTPQNPVYPQETGDKTANLFNVEFEQGSLNTAAAEGTSLAYMYSPSNVRIRAKTLLKVDELGTITISFNAAKYKIMLVGFTSSDYYDKKTEGWLSAPITYPTANLNSIYLDIIVRGLAGNEEITPDITDLDLMINAGSTALPYEPFGYKIPILSNGNTYPIYLSEPLRKIGDTVDSLVSAGTVTYNIKKLVLDGTETGWNKSGRYLGSFYNAILSTTVNACICSHAEFVTVINSTTYVYGKCGFDGSGTLKNLNLFLGEANWSVDDFKNYLATQYANGTPVTIYYVLVTAETGTVTAPTLPTTGTVESFDVDTTLKPSEVSLTYHGWHEHEDTKYTTP